jgi:hypothetical protein
MAVYELARFRVDPENAEKLVSSRDDMVAAMRRRFPALLDARLARLDEDTWIDVWRWSDLEAAKSAAATASEVPEVARMFSLIADVISMEHAEIVHEG